MQITNITFPSSSRTVPFYINLDSYISSFIRCESNDDEDIVLEFAEPDCLKGDKILSARSHGWFVPAEKPSKTYITLSKIDKTATMSIWLEPDDVPAQYAITLLQAAADLGALEFERTSSELSATAESFDKGQVLVVFYDIEMSESERVALENLATL